MRFAYRVTRRVAHTLSPADSSTPITWGRWCLPTFNPGCDQQLKGHLADSDNSLCTGKMVKKAGAKKEETSSLFINGGGTK